MPTFNRKRAPTTVIRMPTEKNAKLKEKKRFASFMEIMAAKYRLSAPIENDRLLKNHVPQTLLGPSRQEKSSSDKKSDLIMFFHLVNPSLYSNIHTNTTNRLIRSSSCDQEDQGPTPTQRALWKINPVWWSIEAAPQ